MSGEFTIRPARSGDGASLADVWIEFGREYAVLDPVPFRVPEEHQEWVDSDLNAERSEDEVWLVAERDERFVGYVQAKIKRPAENAGRQLLRDLGEPVLNVTACWSSRTSVEWASGLHSCAPLRTGQRAGARHVRSSTRTGAV